LLFQSGFCGGPVKIRWQGRARGGIEVAYLVEQPDEVEEFGMAVVKLGMRSSPIWRLVLDGGAVTNRPRPSVHPLPSASLILSPPSWIRIHRSGGWSWMRQ
jgi:hypothetical protein